MTASAAILYKLHARNNESKEQRFYAEDCELVAPFDHRFQGEHIRYDD
jgi:hypothetical protein